MNKAKIFRIGDETASAQFGEKYAKAFEFLRRPDLKKLSPGRYAIDGDKVFAIVSDNDLKSIGLTQTVEFHKKYADIHSPFTGDEVMGLPEMPDSALNGPFDDEKDFAVFEAKCPMQTIHPGECIVCEPPVPHAPCYTEEPGRRLRKVVVKVLV